MLTLAIQCPGSFVLVWSITRDKGPNFSTWGPYAIAGSFQALLLLLCLYFTYVRPPPGSITLGSPDGSKTALNPEASNPSLISDDDTASSSFSLDIDSRPSLQGPLLQPLDLTSVLVSGSRRPHSPPKMRSPHRDLENGATLN